MIRNRARLAQAGFSGCLLAVLLGVRPELVALAPRSTAVAVSDAVLLAAAITGLAAIRSLVDAFFSEASDQRLVIWRNLVAWSLYVLLGILIAAELGVNVSGLLLGGAILGVIAASASQAPLGNFFAGLVMIAGRPFTIGDTIRLRSAIAGGTEYEGTVVDARAFYTTLLTADHQLLRLPNSAVITSVVVVGGEPLQGELELDLPAGVALAEVRSRLESRLPSDASLELVPRSLDAREGRLSCLLRVRARRAIASEELAEGLLEAARAAA